MFEAEFGDFLARNLLLDIPSSAKLAARKYESTIANCVN